MLMKRTGRRMGSFEPGALPAQPRSRSLGRSLVLRVILVKISMNPYVSLTFKMVSRRCQKIYVLPKRLFYFFTSVTGPRTIAVSGDCVPAFDLCLISG